MATPTKTTPIQYSPTIATRHGTQQVSGTCRIEVICITDGEPRVWIDDGHAFNEFRTPGSQRQQILRNLALRDVDGDPMFFCRGKLEPFKGPKIDGEHVIFEPVDIPLLTDRIVQKIEANRLKRAALLGEARGAVGLVGKPPADPQGTVATKAAAGPQASVADAGSEQKADAPKEKEARK